MLTSRPSTLGGREAHAEHVGLDGEGGGGLVCRNWQMSASEKMSLTATLHDTLVRFVALAERVEVGEDDGGHGSAWGGSNRR
jgi:hypothetical protein